MAQLLLLQCVPRYIDSLSTKQHLEALPALDYVMLFVLAGGAN